jgi:hypothetical protein
MQEYLLKTKNHKNKFMDNNLQIIIDYLMKASISIIGVIIGYLIAKNKYVFEKTYERKSILITELYAEIVQLEFELKKYIHFIGADMQTDVLEEKIKSLNKVKTDFQKFQHKFWEVEIILNESSNKKIQEFLTKYIEITSKLSMSNIQQQLMSSDKAFDSWDKSFILFESDLLKIKNELKKDFKNNLIKK